MYFLPSPDVLFIHVLNPCHVQTSHDIHVGKIDGLEDRLVANNMARANQLADSNNSWSAKRHR